MKSLSFLLPILSLTLAVLGNWLACSWGGQTWKNHEPDVAYVGIARCAGCHQDIVNSYAQTGMGRSWYRPYDAPRIETFGHQAHVYDTSSGYYYWPYWQADTLYIMEYRLDGGDTSYRRRERIDYIVGSGNHTRSYVLDRAGFLYEAPITWYSQKKAWDLSPGYEGGHNSRFDRPIGPRCMDCHNGHSQHTPGTPNHFAKVALGIDCESCHGPGQLHVEQRLAGKTAKRMDPTIVNPRHLPIERQFDVCQQCHLQGTAVPVSSQAFRPGQQLAQHLQVFVRPAGLGSGFGIAAQAERLIQSACYIKAPGRLACTSCHDPHRPVQQQVQAMRASCLKCHQDKSCTAPATRRQAAADQCASCHMPKSGTSDIPHVSFTDHWIQKPGAPAPAPRQASTELLVCISSLDANEDLKGRAALRYYEEQEAHTKWLQMARRHLAADSYADQARLAYLMGEYNQAESLLAKALASSPKDLWLLQLQAETWERLQKHAKALQAYSLLYDQNPKMVDAGTKAALLCLATQPGDARALRKAQQLLRTVLQTKPLDLAALTNLAFVELNLGNFVPARLLAQQALQQNPQHLPARRNLLLAQAALGQNILQELENYCKQAHPESCSELKQHLSTLSNSIR